MKKWLVAIVMMLAGCGEANPMTGRLKAGSEAVVFNDPKAPERSDHILAKVPDGTGFHGSDFIVVPFETVIQVLEDQEGEETDDPERQVRVRILEGENKGKSAKIARWFLRSLPTK